MNDCLIPPDDEGTPSMSASTKRRARRAALQAVETATVPSCEVCRIPGDEKTLKNHCSENLPYWLCLNIPECDMRVREARRLELQGETEAQPETEAAAEEPAEVTQ